MTRPVERPRKDSSWVNDDDIDTWYIYRKEFETGLDDTLGAETFLFKHGDIYHVVGELLGIFRDMRRDRHHTFHKKSFHWQLLQINPYCYTIWGRLISDLDKYRLVYIMSMDPKSADIVIYSCYPSPEKEDYYHVFKWRAELPNRHGDLRRYRRSDHNLIGHLYIPPCWPTLESVEYVMRGERQQTYIKRPAYGQSGKTPRDDR